MQHNCETKYQTAGGDECNVKSVELLRLVFMIQEKVQKSEMEVEKMKTETNAKFQKIESEYDALKQDITTINQKIDEGLQRCFEDSEKLIRSTQQQTVSEIRTLNEEAKATSFAEIMKQELEKSLDNMTTGINPAGDAGDTSPQYFGWGDVNGNIPANIITYFWI